MKDDKILYYKHANWCQSGNSSRLFIDHPPAGQAISLHAHKHHFNLRYGNASRRCVPYVEPGEAKIANRAGGARQQCRRRENSAWNGNMNPLSAKLGLRTLLHAAVLQPREFSTSAPLLKLKTRACNFEFASSRHNSVLSFVDHGVKKRWGALPSGLFKRVRIN